MNILDACLGLTELFFVSLGLEKYFGGKYGRSKDGASDLFVQLCLELLSNEHTSCLTWLEMV